MIKEYQYGEKQFFVAGKKGKTEVYNVIREENNDDGSEVVVCGLYQIPSGGICSELVGETRFYYKKGEIKRHYKKTIIY